MAETAYIPRIMDKVLKERPGADLPMAIPWEERLCEICGEPMPDHWVDQIRGDPRRVRIGCPSPDLPQNEGLS